MAYQTVTHTSYGQRVGNSFKGILTGIVLFIGGTVLLWWNEGRAVHETQNLNEMEGAYVEMENISKIDHDMDGQLVWASGMAETTDSLADSQFAVGGVAIKLSRNVEYYQWEEHKHEEKHDKLGGGEETITTYTYEQDWQSEPINSGGFHDPDYQNANFVLAKYDDEEHWAENVSFGAYRLASFQIEDFSGDEPIMLDLPAEQIETIGTNVKSWLAGQDIDTTGMNIVHQDRNVLYIGRSPSTPTTGDVRITFTQIVPQKISIIAVPKGDTFKKYKTKNNAMRAFLRMGEEAPDEIFQEEHDTNTMLTWLLRIVGVLCVIGGLKGIFGIIETLAKVVPFIANIIGFGVGLICTIVGTVWSLIIIALAWVFYRPLLGIGILLVAGGIIYYFAMRGKKKKEEAAAAEATTAAVGQPPVQTPTADDFPKV